MIFIISVINIYINIYIINYFCNCFYRNTKLSCLFPIPIKIKDLMEMHRYIIWPNL